MKSAAARDLDRGDLRERNRLLNASAANFEAIAAIQHLIRQPVHLRLPKEVDQRRTEDPNCNRARQRISPQVPIERRRCGDEQDQRKRAQPNAPLEQSGVFKRNGPHLNTPQGPPPEI